MSKSSAPPRHHLPDSSQGLQTTTVQPGCQTEDLRLIFMEHSIDGIVIMDAATAGVINANTAFARMLGYSREEVLRQKVWDWDANWSREHLEQMFATRNWPAERFETRHRRKDGQVLDVAISVTEILWQGEPVIFCVVKDISESKHQERRLQQELARWELLMERSSDGIVILDGASLAVIEVNPAFAQMLGYTQEEVAEMHPWDWDAHFSRAEIETMGTAHRNLNEERRFETLHRRKDGTLRNVEVHSTPVETEDQYQYFCICRDVTSRKQADEQLHAREREFRTLAENSPDAIVRYDRQLCRLYVNPAFERLLGRDKSDLLGQPLQEFGPSDLAPYQATLETVFHTGQKKEYEIRNRTADERICWIQARFEPEFDEDGSVRSVLVVLRDISDLIEQRELARQLAYTDTLTGLPNRALFDKRFQEAAGRANNTSTPFALLLLDIDHFKDVNDTLGHQTGDELLRQTTMRLSRFIREQDTIARLGGDEFVILLTQFRDADDAQEVAGRILDALVKPFQIEGQELFVSGSIGIALYPQDSTKLNELFTFADTAMYSAKRLGRNNFQFYSPHLTHHATERMSLGAFLRHAVAKEELELLFQPKVLMASGKIIGGEALLRWHHPEQGLLTPDRFITIAEENGAIIDIGHWVLESACHAAVSFNGQSSAFIKVAVNLSSRQFVHHDLAGEVRATLNATGCRGEWLEFEITESLLLEDNRQIRHTLEELRALGITIAIDDFGTGYSALSYLKRFPVDVLKIDRSFVDGIDADPCKAGLVNAFISVGKTLEMNIVAEGVETEAQAKILLQKGCNLGQGYLFGKPQTFKDFTALLPTF